MLWTVLIMGIVLLLLTAAQQVHRSVEEDNVRFQTIDARFEELERINHEQQHVINRLQSENNKLLLEVDRLHGEDDRLQLENERHQLVIQNLQQSVDELKKNDYQHDVTSQPAKHGVSTPVHACIGQNVTLHCEAPFTITVLRGEYGRYTQNCDVECCQPNATDCIEVMSQTNSEEWQSIKATCDGQSSCSYVYEGQTIESCALNYTADYVSILYYCTEFVGFSAYATESQVPDSGVRVLFAGVTTNAGGGYDRATSVFTCPTSAFYYVYIHLWLLIDDPTYDYCYMDIMLDGLDVVTAREQIFDDVQTRTTTSVSVVLECQAGSEIWVQSRSNYCYVFGASTNFQYSIFGGFLLQPL